MTHLSPPGARMVTTIEPIVHRLCSLWGIECIADQIRVEFSSRMTRSLGRTQSLRKIIRLNSKLSTSLGGHLEEVLCHELAHIAAIHKFGRSIRPHGKEWQALVRQASYAPNIRMVLNGQCNTSPRTNTFRHVCPVCHSERIAKRRMTRWRCKNCVENSLNGKLHIEEVA